MATPIRPDWVFLGSLGVPGRPCSFFRPEGEPEGGLRGPWKGLRGPDVALPGHRGGLMWPYQASCGLLWDYQAIDVRGRTDGRTDAGRADAGRCGKVCGLGCLHTHAHPKLLPRAAGGPAARTRTWCVTTPVAPARRVTALHRQRVLVHIASGGAVLARYHVM